METCCSVKVMRGPGAHPSPPPHPLDIVVPLCWVSTDLLREKLLRGVSRKYHGPHEMEYLQGLESQGRLHRSSRDGVFARSGISGKTSQILAWRELWGSLDETSEEKVTRNVLRSGVRQRHKAPSLQDRTHVPCSPLPSNTCNRASHLVSAP